MRIEDTSGIERTIKVINPHLQNVIALFVEYHDTKYKWLKFNPTLKHAVEPSTGTQVLLVFFTSKRLSALTEEHWNALMEKNLARLKAARKDAVSTDLDQSAAVRLRKSDSTEELSHFAAQLPYPQGVVDMAVSENISGHLGTAGRRVTYTLSDSARPKPLPQVEGVHGCLHSKSQRSFKQRWLEMPDSTKDGIGVKSKKLTMHKEPYKDPTSYPWADIEPHPTFEEGRSLNDK
eukprot:5268760-Amphidinium_carterae.1